MSDLQQKFREASNALFAFEVAIFDAFANDPDSAKSNALRKAAFRIRHRLVDLWDRVRVEANARTYTPPSSNPKEPDHG